jgi:hypothetical protein
LKPWFNEPTLALTAAHTNENGELGLPSLKQFLTKYPVVPDNSWIGFVLHEQEEYQDDDDSGQKNG